MYIYVYVYAIYFGYLLAEDDLLSQLLALGHVRLHMYIIIDIDNVEHIHRSYTVRLFWLTRYIT